MTPSASWRHPGLLISLAVLAAVGVVGVAVQLAEPDATGMPAAAPTPEPTPHPEQRPEPEPAPETNTAPEPEARSEPVVGEVGEVDVVDVTVHGTQLFGDRMAQDAPIAVDEAAVDAFVSDVAAWLDSRLTWLQWGLVDDPQVVVPGSHEALGALAATGLADRDTWVATARYDLVVYVRGGVEWARVDIEVAHVEGGGARAALVMVPGDPPAVVAGGSVQGGPA